MLGRFAVVLGTWLSAVVAVAAPSSGEFASSSDKQPIAVSVEFNSPPGCSERTSFESGLRARFPRVRLASTATAVWSLRVSVSLQNGGVKGELRLSDAQGETEYRTVDGADCSGVVEALSLTAALALEQTVALVEGAGAHKPQTVTPRDSTSRAGIALDVERAQTKKSRDGDSTSVTPLTENQKILSQSKLTVPWLRINAGLFATRIVSPQTSFGGTVEFRIAPKWITTLRPEVGLGFVYVPAESLQLKNNVGVAFRSLSLLACPTRLRFGSSASVLPCITTDIGRLVVSTRNVDYSTPSRRLQVLTGLDTRWGRAMGRAFELEFRAALRLPTIERKYVTLEPLQTKGHSQRVSWLLGLGGNVTW
jgi:hypothetical protein